MADSVQTFKVQGIDISAINLEEASDLVLQKSESNEKEYITFSTVHGIGVAQSNSELKSIFNHAYLNNPDGVPLVWIGKWRGFKKHGRVYGPDLMLAVCRKSKANHRHYFYGADEGTAEKLAKNLKSRFPSLEIAGWDTPPYRELNDKEWDQLDRALSEKGANCLWIGLSSPKQELFMAKAERKLTTPVLMLGVGAAFDFHSGNKKQAPLWMQKNGLEWLFRMISEPRRLATRYLIYVPLFIWRQALIAFGLRINE